MVNPSRKKHPLWGKGRSGAERNTIPCKSGSDWKEDELDFFRIKVTRVTSFQEFFGTKHSQVPFEPDVEEFLSLDLSDLTTRQKIDLSGIRSRIVKTVLKDLVAVTKTHRNEEPLPRKGSAVDDLSKSLFQMFEYDSEDRSIRTRENFDLEMANGRTRSTPDLCIESMDLSIKLVVQEDKNFNVGNDKHLANPLWGKGHHPEPQLMAEIIAAFQENVRIYERTARDEIPSEQTIPGIVMLGTCPTFYTTKITAQLSDCQACIDALLVLNIM